MSKVIIILLSFFVPLSAAPLSAKTTRLIVDIGNGARIEGPVTIRDERGRVLLDVPRDSYILPGKSRSSTTVYIVR